MKQNSKQSLFRKFNNFNQYNKEKIDSILCVLWIVSCIITCLYVHFNHRSEVHTYNEHNYEYLAEVVDTIWEEDNKTLNLTNMPDNVYITEGDSSKNYFKCVLDSGHFVTNDPFVEVHISNNSDVEITHYTKSQYVGDARASFAMFYIFWCLFCFLAMMAGWWLIKLSIYILCIALDLVVQLYSWLMPHDTEKAK